MPETPPGGARSRWFCWQPEARLGTKLEGTVAEEDDETTKDSFSAPQVPLEITYVSGSGDQASPSKPDFGVVTSSMGKLQTILKEEHEDSSLSMALLSQSQSRSVEGEDSILEDLANIAARIQNGENGSSQQP